MPRTVRDPRRSLSPEAARTRSSEGRRWRNHTTAFLVLVFGALQGLSGAERKTPIGLRADGTVIHAWITAASYQVAAPAPHVLVVGTAPFEAQGWTVTRLEAPTAALTFPPRGVAYTGAEREAHVLWRWVGTLGPDAVVGNDALSAALVDSGRVRVWHPQQTDPSPARLELRRRLDRTPLVLARQLGTHYGHAFGQVTYIPALALIGRLQVARQTSDLATVQEVARLALAAPVPPSPDGPALAGHLVFAALAAEGGDDEALSRVRFAAASARSAEGASVPFVPGHREMSDAVFLNGPILAAAGRLTGDPLYYQAALNHVRFMRRLCLRPDGLYRHSPLNEAAWGRGNGFPALGLALMVSDWPASVPGREELLKNLRDHLDALIPFQNESGLWHQVIDHPESYREFSCTCMIAFAMARGMREGWLDRRHYASICRRAWEAILLRIDLEGKELVDVCTGTGKFPTLEDYLLRPAILGRDDRGGAMALLLAAELAQAGGEESDSLPRTSSDPVRER